jgi:alginate O-acetyltransferase complex protein AlgI
MQFNSYSYILLLIPVVALFWALPPSWRRWYVLAVSIAYYATWNAAFVAVPLLLCGGVQAAASALLAAPERARRAWFRAGIAWVLLLFLFFRYRQFLLDNLDAALAHFGAAPLTAAFALGVPLGISFYSFEAISYMIDAKQARIKESRFSNLYLFVMFWPHLMAGPIVRFRELVPQFGFSKRFDLAMLFRGLDRLVWGLLLKNVFANSLGGWVDEGFLPGVARANTTLDNWTLAVAFGLQIYFDFAAYSNMAIGVAQMIGVTLPENFRFPYHAQTPPEFWSRWHMTLSRWIRDYLFFPVNARFGAAPGPLYLSLLGIMALVGLWHGAGWGFVLWGVLHGCYLVLYRIWEGVREKHWPALSTSRAAAWAWRIFTLIAVTAAWVPFRAATAGVTAHMLASMFGRFRFGVSYSVNFYLITALFTLFCAVEPKLSAGWGRLQSAADAGRLPAPVWIFLLRPAIYAVGLLFFLMFDDRSMQFIYFQF